MHFFNCNILQGASITEPFQVCLVLSQTLGEGALAQVFCWYVREKWGSQFSLVACDDCLEVCFLVLVVERICVWYLVMVAIFMGFGQAGPKRCWGCLKVTNLGWRCNSQKGSSFNREGRLSLCNMLNCETLLQVLLDIYCKRFYWIPLFTKLLF